MRPVRGFTLLEVLVALAVLAVALGALLKAAASSGADLIELRDRTLAGWVAENAVNELRLGDTWPSSGSTLRGNETLAGAEWRWTITVQPTPDPDLRRLEVSVLGPAGESPVRTLVAFLGHAR